MAGVVRPVRTAYRVSSRLIASRGVASRRVALPRASANKTPGSKLVLVEVDRGALLGLHISY